MKITTNNYSSHHGHTDLETRNYCLRALSDVKKIISNQCDLHFYECIAEYVTSLNLRNVVYAR